MPRGAENAGQILPVDGSPSALSGRYLCIESDPSSGSRVHCVVLHSGTAASYRQRLISTRVASGAPTTNVIEFAGRIVALVDGAIAQELASNLESTPVDAAGRHLGVGAYPKKDPLTGELHLISSPGETTALHHVLSAGGMTRRTHPIDDAPAPVVDLAITTHRVVLLADGFIGVTDRNRNEPIAWLPSRPTRPGRIVDAYDDDGDVVLLHIVAGRLERWTASAAVLDYETLDATPQRTSRLNEKVTGSRHRYLYGVSGHRRTTSPSGSMLFKHDLIAGSRADRAFGDGRQAGEFLFAVDPDRHVDEDGGWLLGVVDDNSTEHSSLVVLDAADVAGPTVATIHLPRRISDPLRSLWVPSPSRTQDHRTPEPGEADLSSPSPSSAQRPFSSHGK